MAITHFTWFGAVIEFDDNEITHIANSLNTTAAGAGLLATLLVGIGVTGPAALIAGAVGGLMGLGGAALMSCNSNKRGILLYVVWVGVPWCRTR